MPDGGRNQSHDSATEYGKEEEEGSSLTAEVGGVSTLPERYCFSSESGSAVYCDLHTFQCSRSDRSQNKPVGTV